MCMFINRPSSQSLEDVPVLSAVCLSIIMISSFHLVFFASRHLKFPDNIQSCFSHDLVSVAS